MKKISLLLLLGVLSLCACRKEIDNIIVEKEEAPPVVYIESALRGRVINEEGLPIPNATITVENEIVQADENGLFHLKKVKIKKTGAMVKANSNGFFNASSHTNFRADGGSFVELTMIQKGVAKVIQSTENNSFTNEQGVNISIPANSIVDQNGTVYNGSVSVYSRHLDPTDANLGAIMPGDLIASDEDGNRLALETFGMLVLGLEDAAGMPLEIRDTEEILVEIPIPEALLTEAPEDIDLWLFDLEEEQWLLKGKCTKSSGYYQCPISTTGYWNCDVSMPAICLSGQFYNSDSTFSAYLQVIIEDLNNNFIYWGYTDSLGYFCGSVPQASPLRIIVKDLCDNIVYTADIGPYSDDFDLGEIYLDEVISEYIINITGTVLHCVTADVPNGHVAVRYPGHIKLYPFNAGGFAFDLGLKCVAFPNLEISAYSHYQQNSTVVTTYADFQDIDLGLQQTCEELPDYFKLTINAVEYWAAPTRWYLKNNTTTNWLVLDGLSSEGKLKIDLQNYSGVGSYTNNSFLKTENINSPNIIFPIINASSPDITVDITLDDGTYIEGTVSGEVTDIAGTVVNIDGEFRIRKAP